MKITGVLKVPVIFLVIINVLYYIASIPTIVDAIIKINIENTTILPAKFFIFFFFFFFSLSFFIKLNLPIIN